MYVYVFIYACIYVFAYISQHICMNIDITCKRVELRINMYNYICKYITTSNLIYMRVCVCTRTSVCVCVLRAYVYVLHVCLYVSVLCMRVFLCVYQCVLGMCVRVCVHNSVMDQRARTFCGGANRPPMSCDSICIFASFFEEPLYIKYGISIVLLAVFFLQLK